MGAPVTAAIDLMPPAFAEGLDDWSRGDGTPGSPTYEDAVNAWIADGDADFGTCLELFKIEAVQRLRYMAELPVPQGGCIEIAARLKVMRGPAPGVCVATWPGGRTGEGVPGLPTRGPITLLPREGTVRDVRAVIGPVARAGIDIVWDARAVYAHVGIDLVGPDGGVVRLDRIRVRDVSAAFGLAGPGA